eukprot:3386482-Pleurochrysis_carterae.AAC.3
MLEGKAGNRIREEVTTESPLSLFDSVPAHTLFTHRAQSLAGQSEGKLVRNPLAVHNLGIGRCADADVEQLQNLLIVDAYQLEGAQAPAYS